MKTAILYGTETGNAEGLARDAKTYFDSKGREFEVYDMEYVTVDQLARFDHVLIITSTWGDGDPPSNAEALHQSLQSEGINLSSVSYAVFAIGMESFDRFCQTGKDFDLFMEQRGARRLLPVSLSDDDFDKAFPEWLERIEPLLV